VTKDGIGAGVDPTKVNRSHQPSNLEFPEKGQGHTLGQTSEVKSQNLGQSGQIGAKSGFGTDEQFGGKGKIGNPGIQQGSDIGSSRKDELNQK